MEAWRQAEHVARGGLVERSLEVVAQLEATESAVPNVLAKIPGGDLADEYVLFGAHFDQTTKPGP